MTEVILITLLVTVIIGLMVFIYSMRSRLQSLDMKAGPFQASIALADIDDESIPETLHYTVVSGGGIEPSGKGDLLDQFPRDKYSVYMVQGSSMENFGVTSGDLIWASKDEDVSGLAKNDLVILNKVASDDSAIKIRSFLSVEGNEIITANFDGNKKILSKHPKDIYMGKVTHILKTKESHLTRRSSRRAKRARR